MASLGQQLRAARERKRKTLSQLAADTRVKVQLLEMMERDDFSGMPAPMYARGFLRIYADALGLDPAPLVEEYIALHQGKKKPAPAPERARKTVPPTARPTSKPAPKPAADPAPEQAAPAPAVVEDVPAAPPAPARPAQPRRAAWKMPRLNIDWSAWKVLATRIPWRALFGALAVVGVVLLVANGMTRCARRMTQDPATARPLSFKKGVPAVIEEPKDPYVQLETLEEQRP
jgi:transcriptional regulator with XRE-family HTH domain